MAGDWIKVEKATARKPEVLRLADLLGVHPDHAFGLCVRFWFWCDDQMSDGHAASVTTVTLNAAFGHAGFVESLVEVGWLRVRDGSLEVPNFDRHLSESAKKRSLSGKRQQKRRHANVTKVSRSKRNKCVTREEKRREDTPSDSTNLQECKTPTRFVPPTVEQVKAYCEERGNTVDPQRFVDHYTANGWRVGKNAMKDWRASVRTWERTDHGNGKSTNGTDLFAGLRASREAEIGNAG